MAKRVRNHPLSVGNARRSIGKPSTRRIRVYQHRKVHYR